jgi:DNA-binding response OmpR family regulator
MGRVLVIDDEPDVLLLCRVNLEYAGHEVLEAQDGEHGIADAVAQLPDAIVLDLMLPNLDGYQVLRELREDARTRDLPVLILTAKVQLEDHRRCLQLGADAFLTKPFSPEVLSEALHDVLALGDDERTARREAALESLAD